MMDLALKLCPVIIYICNMLFGVYKIKLWTLGEGGGGGWSMRFKGPEAFFTTFFPKHI
jgi:hypothetical protein